MFTASNGAYRRAKIVIDWINIILGVVMLVMTTVIFLMPQQCDILLPVVFFCGAGINGLHVVKSYFKFQGKKAVLLAGICLALLVLSYVSAKVLW
ncbi:MAG: hypothetical protein ACI4AQ_04090 [Lachnospiraceae bacterium]